jgi:hypothetical protein
MFTFSGNRLRMNKGLNTTGVSEAQVQINGHTTFMKPPSGVERGENV